MFGVLKPSLSKRPAATSPSRTSKRGRPARQPPSPSQQRRSSQSALSSELPSLDVPPDRRPVREIRPLSSKDAQPDRHPVREVRPARRSSVRAINARNVLVADFAQRKEAAASFPPLLTDTSTRNAITQFQSHINTVIADTNDVCACCGLLIVFGTGSLLTRVHPEFVSAIEAGVIVEDDLDCCGYTDNGFQFCKSCYGMIIEKKIPKFGSANCINVSPCQKYPDILSDLTPVEEALIARAHPVMSIIKLRPSGSGSSASYYRIRGHTVVLPQNPGPLLTILPSSTLAPHDVIRIAWASKRPHTPSDIRSFARVRRNRVLEALRWLKANNPLYTDIVINLDLLDTWEDEFVPVGIASRVLQCEPDISEREGYSVDLEADNLENELHHAVDAAGLNDSGCLSGCLYTDADDAREHPTTKLISALANHKDSETPIDPASEAPVLTYQSRGYVKPLNDWDNPDFFTAAFPTLFPFGVGGHLTKKDEPGRIRVSLQSWAKWTLSHHSRRFARHSAFMFLLYDVINRRQSSLGYSLLTKRKFWGETCAKVNAITLSQLEAAAAEIKETGKCTDPDILMLERQVQIVASKTPHSFAKCANQATHIKALMLSDGMPVLWITINPSDLRSTLVLILAGMRYEDNGVNNSAEAFARMTATMNPVAVARFFEATCRGIFEHLLAAGSKDGGLLGPVSTYFGTVETNGRGMLHLHCLVWLRGAFHISQLRDRLQADSEYAARVVVFINRIIRCSIKPEDEAKAPQPDAPSASLDESDSSFALKLDADSNAVAKRFQMHSSTHNATCYKYGAAATGQCRFDFPRPMNEQTKITAQGNIEVFRNNVWVNPWCPAIASLIRSNHDINFIPSNVKALALVRYITNYATKGDCSQYQRVMGAAFVRKAFEDAAARPDDGEPTKQIRFVDVDKFALRAFNRLAYDREISGPLAASSLLELPEYYTPQRSIRRINLYSLRQKIASLLFSGKADTDFSDQLVPLDRSKRLPPSMFDNYQWRGPELAQYSLYDYFKLVSIVSHKTDEGIPFAKDHPQFRSVVQHLCNASPCKTLVALVGPLSTNEAAEDAIRGGHPDTDARQNDIGMILLGLFVPWDQLQSRFLSYNATILSYSNLSWQIWLDVKPSLDEYILYCADNVLQMRKSQIEVKLDQEQRREAKELATEASLRELVEQDEVEDSVQDPHSVNELDLLDTKSLQQAICITLHRWRSADITECLEYTSLAHTQHCLRNAEDNTNSESDFLPDVDLSSASPHATMYPGVMPNITLEAADVWRKIQKQALTKRIDIVEMETDGTDISTPFQASIQSMSAIEALEPVLISSSLPDPTSSQPLHNISPANADCKAVADHINAVLPLNTLQRLVVEGVLDHVIRNKGRLCVTREDQLLLYVRGEGGVGKSRVIHALEMGFTLLDRRNELMLSAPTGCAAEGIGGSTVHTALSISTRNVKSSSTNVSAIWTHRSSLIIDELSMIPLGLLATMDKQLRKARGAIVSSTALFGGLPLVILMGDFYQFAPVSGHALWDSPYSEDEIHGKVLWDNFRSVLSLTEQMRQRSDLAFQAMLKRARHGLLNVEDVNSLNARVATHLPDSDFADTVIIVQKNKTRHLINRLQAENFARSHNMDLILFPAEHSRNKKDGGNLIQHEDLLGVQEGEGNAAGPGILYYCKGMPAMVLANQCTPLGIVNGARVTIYGVVPHPQATFQRIGSFTILCSRPPHCMLLQRQHPLKAAFPDLPTNVFPLFPVKSTVSLQGISINRMQIPLTPAFAVTDYKVQGATFKTAILDLQRSQFANNVSHKAFCSTYVQLSRLQSLEGVQLLQTISLKDINNQPNPRLPQATTELDVLSRNTLDSWTLRFNERRRGLSSPSHAL